MRRKNVTGKFGTLLSDVTASSWRLDSASQVKSMSHDSTPSSRDAPRDGSCHVSVGSIRLGPVR